MFALIVGVLMMIGHVNTAINADFDLCKTSNETRCRCMCYIVMCDTQRLSIVDAPWIQLTIDLKGATMAKLRYRNNSCGRIVRHNRYGDGIVLGNSSSPPARQNSVLLNFTWNTDVWTLLVYHNGVCWPPSQKCDYDCPPPCTRGLTADPIPQECIDID